MGCYGYVIGRCHNMVTGGIDLNSFPCWKPSLTGQLMGIGWNYGNNEMMSRWVGGGRWNFWLSV